MKSYPENSNMGLHPFQMAKLCMPLLNDFEQLLQKYEVMEFCKS